MRGARPAVPVAFFPGLGSWGSQGAGEEERTEARGSPISRGRRLGHHMARVLVARMLASALSPLFRRSPGPAKTRVLSTLLAGPAGPRPPPLPGLQLALGFKTKGVIKERCRDCYRVKRRGRWFIYCKTNPKHKQRQM
ncbi:large ribosomal subunit protein bL36m isoform X1 [Crocuta crocuta]